MKEEKISAQWFCPDLNQHVKQLIYRYAACLLNNIDKGTPLQPGKFPTPKGSCVHLAMDFLDMVERKERKTYCLVIIDRFNRWVEAFPTTNCDV